MQFKHRFPILLEKLRTIKPQIKFTGHSFLFLVLNKNMVIVSRGK